MPKVNPKEIILFLFLLYFLEIVLIFQKKKPVRRDLWHHNKGDFNDTNFA
jgi:hypothetical protein